MSTLDDHTAISCDAGSAKDTLAATACIELNKRRLQVLKEQQAQTGLQNQPHSLIEIEDIHENIRYLEVNWRL
jgi:hypothetical protein